MISSSWFFGKWHLSPAVAEIIPNGALMVLPEAFQLRLIGPHHPAVEGLIELACPHQTLPDPGIETRAGDCQHANQLCRPPFIRQASAARPGTRACRSHS